MELNLLYLGIKQERYPMTDRVATIMQSTPILSNMVTPLHINYILTHLEKSLLQNTEGDIVELGCNVGTTSLFIRKMLDAHQSDKNFCVYDSFEGLPEKSLEDQTNTTKQYKQGSCKTSLETFMENFDHNKLKQPIIHQGWFKEIEDTLYPKQIAFAFFDGDFYSSILDSFEKVYPKLSRGARVIIHDYGFEALPGVKKACDEFLKDKPEKVEVLEAGVSLGLMIKQ